MQVPEYYDRADLFVFGKCYRYICPGKAASTKLLKAGKTETIKTALGVKSVLVSPDGSKVFSINLEGMSVYEFDRASRKILRKLEFIPHPGTGFDSQGRPPLVPTRKNR